MKSSAYIRVNISMISIWLIFILILTVSYSCNKSSKIDSQGNKTDTGRTETGNKELKSSDDFIISYNMVGKLGGTMEMLRKGNKLRQNINSEIMGMKSENVIYIVDNYVYSIMILEGKKIGMKTSLQDYNSQKTTGETIVDFKEFENFLNGKKITGSENILGYNCDIYDIGKDVSLSVYNKRYILKIKTPEFMATATKLDNSPTLPADEFDVPPDVDFRGVSSRNIDKKYLDSLVNKMKK